MVSGKGERGDEKGRRLYQMVQPSSIQSQVWKCQKSESLLVLFAGRQDQEKFQNTATRI